MLTYTCPKCGRTLQSPESEAGETVDCPKCQNVMRVPFPVKGSSLPVWFLVILLVLFGGCGCIVVSLVAITALGTSANQTFGTVKGSVGPPTKQVVPAQPNGQDDKDD